MYLCCASTFPLINKSRAQNPAFKKVKPEKDTLLKSVKHNFNPKIQYFKTLKAREFKENDSLNVPCNITRT